MNYISPSAAVYLISTNIVSTSEFVDPGTTGGNTKPGNSGGIQLPFIPG